MRTYARARTARANATGGRHPDRGAGAPLRAAPGSGARQRSRASRCPRARGPRSDEHVLERGLAPSRRRHPQALPLEPRAARPPAAGRPAAELSERVPRSGCGAPHTACTHGHRRGRPSPDPRPRGSRARRAARPGTWRRQRRGAVARQHLPAVDDRHAVATAAPPRPCNASSAGTVRPGCSGTTTNELPQLPCRVHVHAERRLVRNRISGSLMKRVRSSCAGAGRWTARLIRAFRLFRDPTTSMSRSGAAPRVVRRHAVELPEHPQALAHREDPVAARLAARHQRDAPPQPPAPGRPRRSPPRSPSPRSAASSVLRILMSVVLPAPVRPQQAEDLAALDPQADPGERVHFAAAARGAERAAHVVGTHGRGVGSRRGVMGRQARQRARRVSTRVPRVSARRRPPCYAARRGRGRRGRRARRAPGRRSRTASAGTRPRGDARSRAPGRPAA